MKLKNVKCVIIDFDKTLYSDANWKDSKDYYFEYLFEKKIVKNEQDIEDIVKKYPNFHTIQCVYKIARENNIPIKDTKKWFAEHIYDFTCDGLRVLDLELLMKLCENYPVYLITDSCEEYIDKYFKLFGYDKKWFKRCIFNDYKSEEMTKDVFMKKIVEETGLEVEQVLMIGDSLRCDIIPAQKIGIQNLQVFDVSDTENIFKKLIKQKEVK